MGQVSNGVTESTVRLNLSVLQTPLIIGECT